MNKMNAISSVFLLVLFALATNSNPTFDVAYDAPPQPQPLMPIECFPEEHKRDECYNRCSCANGVWRCTMMWCESPDALECQVGQIKMDGKKRCRCDAGFWACSSSCAPINRNIKEEEISQNESDSDITEDKE